MKSQIVEAYENDVLKFEEVLVCIIFDKIHSKVGWFLMKKCQI